MSKIRNSLGVLVLPTTDSGQFSFEEYEKQTGINPHSLLVFDSDGYPSLKPDISKIICLDQTKVCQSFDEIIGADALRIAVVTSIAHSLSETVDYKAYRLVLGATKYQIVFSHKVYLDGTTPDELLVFSSDI